MKRKREERIEGRLEQKRRAAALGATTTAGGRDVADLSVLDIVDSSSWSALADLRRDIRIESEAAKRHAASQQAMLLQYQAGAGADLARDIAQRSTTLSEVSEEVHVRRHTAR